MIAPMQGNPDPALPRIFEALEKVGVRPECPTCGQENQWTVSEHLCVLPWEGQNQGIKAAALVCGRCGLVQFHATHVLA